MEVLKQPQYMPYRVDRQIYELFVAKNRFLDKTPINLVQKKLKEGYENLNVTDPNLLKAILKDNDITKEYEERLLKHCKDFYQ